MLTRLGPAFVKIGQVSASILQVYGLHHPACRHVIYEYMTAPRLQWHMLTKLGLQSLINACCLLNIASPFVKAQSHTLKGIQAMQTVSTNHHLH